MKLDSIRTEYEIAELLENSIEKNPLKQFEHWLNDALNAKVNEPTAMSVATFGVDGFPDLYEKEKGSWVISRLAP
jgi:pyridoxamine 5'-phosphate oxidase